MYILSIHIQSYRPIYQAKTRTYYAVTVSERTKLMELRSTFYIELQDFSDLTGNPYDRVLDLKTS